MPKAFRRFLKKLPKKIQTIKYSFREFYLQKYEIAIVVNKFLISIFLIKIVGRV